MKNKLLLEELKRFNGIISYNPKNPRITEDTSNVVNTIINKIDLPLNDTSDKIESILLLQKTLVALGKLKKTYGIDGDGVDGDFGNDTKSALYNTIKSEELSTNNIDDFEYALEKNKSKITNVISNYEVFIEKFNKQAGVSLDYLKKCKGNTDFQELKFIPKVKKCHLIKDIAISLDEVFPNESVALKSAILSVMMKEQGKGKYICAPNNNYAGVQTDSGKWGEKAKLFSAQFCAKDAERVRSFASFENLNDALQFIKEAFDNKNWEVRLLKDVDEDDVELSDEKLEELSKSNSEIWQTHWNLSFMKEGNVDEERYQNFLKNGYNPDMKSESFTDSLGVYKKGVDQLTTDELKKHNSNIKNYRSPEKIEKSLNTMDELYKKSYKIFKNLENDNLKNNSI